MKKKLSLLFTLCFNIAMFAEEIPYFSTTAMEAYVELTDPVSINNGEIWNEGSTYPIYFDFEFTIFDQTYSSLNVDAGGGISLAGLGQKSIFVYHTPFGGFLLKDKGVDTSVSGIDYEITGEEGHHIIKIQWKNSGFVQWYPTSDTSDYVNFQIWIFQADSHIELHFGSSQTNPGTYGYPDATSDPNPGPSIKFIYDDCSSVMAYFYAADNPSYDYIDICSPNYSFVDGTPSEEIVYNIMPNQDYVDIPKLVHEKISVFPNPARNYFHIEGITDLSWIESISVIDMQGKVLIYKQNIDITETKITIDATSLPIGIYYLKIDVKNESIIKKLTKTNI